MPSAIHRSQVLSEWPRHRRALRLLWVPTFEVADRNDGSRRRGVNDLTKPKGQGTRTLFGFDPRSCRADFLMAFGDRRLCLEDNPRVANHQSEVTP